MPLAAAVAATTVWASLAALCVAKPAPLTSTYGSSIYHVSGPVASSHQSVTLSELHSLTEHTAHELARDRAHHDHHDHHDPYKFEYKVHDEKSTNYHERAESSDGQVVRGFYSLLEPHGEVRVVKYRADHDGFQSEVSRHGQPRGREHGGGLGATIGGGPAHDLGSHGLGVSASALSAASAASAVTVHKQSIPIHEETQEGNNNEWSAIEGPKKGLRGQALEEIPAPSKEVLGGGPRVPEQFLLQQHKKKKASQHGLHGKPGPHLHHAKFHKRPLYHGPPRPGGPGPRPHPPHFHHARGPKRGPRPRNAGPPGPPPGPPGPPAPPVPQRREARPPPTPCQCSEQPPGHAAHAPGHPPPPHGG